ncbi:hypothetical protein HN446_02340 [bacterium]|jgi:hypothetical protein|nr:hypothetical protein [bacterium]
MKKLISAKFLILFFIFFSQLIHPTSRKDRLKNASRLAQQRKHEQAGDVYRANNQPANAAYEYKKTGKHEKAGDAYSSYKNYESAGPEYKKAHKYKKSGDAFKKSGDEFKHKNQPANAAFRYEWAGDSYHDGKLYNLSKNAYKLSGDMYKYELKVATASQKTIELLKTKANKMVKMYKKAKRYDLAALAKKFKNRLEKKWEKIKKGLKKAGNQVEKHWPSILWHGVFG